MPGTLHKFNYHVTASHDFGPEPLRGIRGREAATAAATVFSNDEAAARYHLERAFSRDSAPALRGLSAPDNAGVLPSLRYVGVQAQPKTDTRAVLFVQTQNSIPIFGSKVVVELDRDRNFVSANGEVAELQQISKQASVSPQQALVGIANSAAVAPDQLSNVESPELNLYKDETQTWHLVYCFRRVPAVPPQEKRIFPEPKALSGHGLAASPRDLDPRYDYLVDAHSGLIIFYYSSDPMFSAVDPKTAVPIPAKCVGQGEGEEETSLVFWGRSDGDTSGTPTFKMSDPLRNIATYDLLFKDLMSTPLPTEPISNTSGDWGSSNRAAVSAHVNLTRVFDFFNSVLMRAGMDNKRMQLIGIVNCVYPRSEPSPEWHNAVWYNDRMWFGQNKGTDGGLHSYSRFLDVIAHELTHGVTQYTCNLVYRDQSGALNESLSDIFGVIINNWYGSGADSDVRKWNWQIGLGLGASGGPLRDMSNPKLTGDPDHMSAYVTSAGDNGGVHTNSNIHNKAAHNLLTACDLSGQLMFKPSEVALFYYLAMTRLGRLADFSEMRDMLLTVARTYYMADWQGRPKKLDAIAKAYQAVGI